MPTRAAARLQALNIALNNISLLDISLTLNQIIRCGAAAAACPCAAANAAAATLPAVVAVAAAA